MLCMRVNGLKCLEEHSAAVHAMSRCLEGSVAAPLNHIFCAVYLWQLCCQLLVSLQLLPLPTSAAASAA
jgi:hypothetical protein